MNAAGLQKRLSALAHLMAEAAERLQQAVADLQASQQEIQQEIQQSLEACKLDRPGEEKAASAARMPHQLPETGVTSNPGGNGGEEAAVTN